MKIQAILLAGAAMFAATSVQAATSVKPQSFNFTAALPYASTTDTVVTGSFKGVLNGNLISDLSDISVFLNGTAFNRNGSLFASSYDLNTGWKSGGAMVSLDGKQNNFLFIDSDYPNDFSFNNYFYSVSAARSDYAYDSRTGQFGYNFSDNGPLQSTLQVTAAGGVPEPAAWAMMIGGFGLVGGAMRAQRRQTRMRVTFA